MGKHAHHFLHADGRANASPNFGKTSELTNRQRKDYTSRNLARKYSSNPLRLVGGGLTRPLDSAFNSKCRKAIGGIPFKTRYTKRRQKRKT